VGPVALLGGLLHCVEWLAASFLSLTTPPHFVFSQADRSAADLSKLAKRPVTDLDDSPITMGMFATSKQWWLEIGGM
jgi:hypothetical protein